MTPIKLRLNYCQQPHRHPSVIFTLVSEQALKKPSTPRGSVTNEIFIGAVNNHGGKDCTLSARCTHVINDLWEWKVLPSEIVPQLPSAAPTLKLTCQLLRPCASSSVYSNTHTHTHTSTSYGPIVVTDDVVAVMMMFTLSTHLLKCLYKSTDNLYFILFVMYASILLMV